MNLPLEIKQKIEDLTKNIPLKNLQNVFDLLSKSYLENSNTGLNKKLNRNECLVYALTRANATYGSFSDVFTHLKEEMDLSFIKSVLDIGGGIGTNEYALSLLLNKDLDFKIIEQNENMIEIGKSIFPNLANSFIQSDFVTYNYQEHFDLIICSYSLNEIDNKNRLFLIEKLFKLTNLLVIVEPGTPFNHQELEEIKNALIKENGYIIAPCLFQEKCPLKENDWCHFVSRVERSKIHKYLKNADVPYEDEKYTYLVMSKNKSTQNDNYRILRHPIITKNSITFKCCGNKTIKNISIFKKDKEYFKLVKKKSIGDVINENN